MKTRQVSAADANATTEVLVTWRDRSPETSREQVAVVCRRSVSTIDRWFKGLGEPTVSDVRSMEAYKPGLVDALFAPGVVKRRSNGAGRGARA